MQVFEVENRLVAARIEVRHDGQLLQIFADDSGLNDLACHGTKPRALDAALPRIASTSCVTRSK